MKIAVDYPGLCEERTTAGTPRWRVRVAGQKNASDPVFNNTNINIRNVEIETLANGKDIFYIDVNEAVCDENGNLYADWTFDQIHLKAKYYQVWENFLMEHGIVKK